MGKFRRKDVGDILNRARFVPKATFKEMLWYQLSDSLGTAPGPNAFLSRLRRLVFIDQNRQSLREGDETDMRNSRVLAVFSAGVFALAVAVFVVMVFFNPFASEAPSTGSEVTTEILPGTPTPVSLVPMGEPGSTPTPITSILDGGVASLSISDDGQVIVFETYPDSQGIYGIFLHKRETGETRFVVYGGRPILLADGLHFAFLNRGADNPILIYDWTTGAVQTTVKLGVSVEFFSFDDQWDVSADGRYVVFLSRNSGMDPVPLDSAVYNMSLYDAKTGVTEHIWLEGLGDTSYYSFNPDSSVDGFEILLRGLSPSVSTDGRYVAFQSITAPDGPDSPRSGVYVYDRDTGRAEFIGEGSLPQISADASTVVYISNEGAPDRAQGGFNLVAHNLETGEVRWVGAILDFRPSELWIDRLFTLSVDGSKIVFLSALDDPCDLDTLASAPSGEKSSADSTYRIFVYDWATDSVERADDIPGGDPLPWDAHSRAMAISRNGRFVAFLAYQADRGGKVHGLVIRDLEQNTLDVLDVGLPGGGS